MQEELLNECWFLLHTFSLNIFHDAFFQIQLKFTCLAIDSSVAEMFAASIEVQKNKLTDMVVVCRECFEASLRLDGQSYTVHVR